MIFWDGEVKNGWQHDATKRRKLSEDKSSSKKKKLFHGTTEKVGGGKQRTIQMKVKQLDGNTDHAKGKIYGKKHVGEVKGAEERNNVGEDTTTG